MIDESKVNEIKAFWQAKGLKCEISVVPPGESWSSASHPTDEVLIPLEGEFEVSFQGKTIHSSIGEEIVIPAGSPHAFKNNDNTDSRMYWLYDYEHKEGVTGIRG